MPDDPSKHDRIGLALSGGGSRAAAFHRGTLRAVHELGWLPEVLVVSTVSGGSVFGAAWIAAILRRESPAQFLDRMATELRKGFIWRGLMSFNVLRVPFPGYTRTMLLGDAFGRLLLDDLPLSQLPERPKLVLNTTVLNHAQVGRFTREGFATWNLRPTQNGRLVSCPIDISLGRAVAASAAFPFGLAPLEIAIGSLFGASPQDSLAGAKKLYLTDGGVLENLGVQTLQRSRTYGCDRIVVSDADTALGSWHPGLLTWLRTYAIYNISAETLERLLLVMSDKQNRSMRQIAVGDALPSEVATLLAQSDPEAAAEILDALGYEEPSRVLMTRVNQTWEHFIRDVSTFARVKLARRAGDKPSSIPPRRARLDVVLSWLERVLTRDERCWLAEAQRSYDEQLAITSNAVATSFVALSKKQIDALERHARWQLYAGAAIYGGL